MSVDVMDEEWLLSREQVGSLLESIRANSDGNRSVYPFLCAVAEGPLRTSEARALRVRDVVLRPDGFGDLTVRHGGVARRIPVTPQFVGFLREWIGRAGLQEDDLLFPGARGGALAASSYQRIWQEAQEAVLPQDKLHWCLGEPISILRESRLVELLRTGVSPFAVAEVAGVNPAWLALRYPYCFRRDSAGIDWSRLAKAMALPAPSMG
jgi:integrase